MPLSTSHAKKATVDSAVAGSALTPRPWHHGPEYLEIAAVGPPSCLRLLLPRQVGGLSKIEGERGRQLGNGDLISAFGWVVTPPPISVARNSDM